MEAQIIAKEFMELTASDLECLVFKSPKSLLIKIKKLSKAVLDMQKA